MFISLNVPLLYNITGTKKLKADGTTLRQIIGDIDSRHTGFKQRAIVEGHIAGYFQVYMRRENKEIIPLNHLDEDISDGVEILFLPIVCGG